MDEPVDEDASGNGGDNESGSIGCGGGGGNDDEKMNEKLDHRDTFINNKLQSLSNEMLDVFLVLLQSEYGLSSLPQPIQAKQNKVSCCHCCFILQYNDIMISQLCQDARSSCRHRNGSLR